MVAFQDSVLLPGQPLVELMHSGSGRRMRQRLVVELGLSKVRHAAKDRGTRLLDERQPICNVEKRSNKQRPDKLLNDLLVHSTFNHFDVEETQVGSVSFQADVR